jgi:hypothetical protein
MYHVCTYERERERERKRGRGREGEKERERKRERERERERETCNKPAKPPCSTQTRSSNLSSWAAPRPTCASIT